MDDTGPVAPAATGERLVLFRPEDLLHLEFEFVGLRVSDDGTHLVPVEGAADCLLVVHFPAQATAEAVFTAAVVPPPVRTVLSGPTRLVFRVPSDVSVPLTVDGLLTWDDWEPVLPPTALPRGTQPHAAIPPPAVPGPHETAVEFPWRLVLSPDAAGRWRTGAGTDLPQPPQLWAAVLGAPRDAGGGEPPPADVRAVAAFEGPRPFETALDGLTGTRQQIVRLSSDFHLPVPSVGGTTRYTPQPITARRLELTALGATADLEAAWDYPLVAPGQEPPGYVRFDLREYRHAAALGRDDRVQTVTVGFLCGLGHRAVVTITVERLPASPSVVGHAPSGGALFGAKAYLAKSASVLVQQPVVDYRALGGAFAHDGREFPFASVRLLTRTARIRPPQGDGPFWLLTPDGAPLQFQAVATDLAGRSVALALPLVFVPFSKIAAHRDIRAVFAAPDAAALRVLQLDGQPVTVAPAGDRPGSTTLTAASARYDIEQPPHPADPAPAYPMDAAAAPPSWVPRFLPRVDQIRASVPAVEDLLGTATPVRMVLDPVYLERGLVPTGNRAQTFARLVDALPLALHGQRGGGLAAPATTAEALSRTLGPVSAPAALQSGRVDLSAFAGTKLLGTLPLVDLLPVDMPFDTAVASTPPTPQQLDDSAFVVNPPRLTTRREPAGAGVPDLVESRFVWKPPLASRHEVTPLFVLELAGADLLLDATTRLRRGGSAEAQVFGRLRAVRLVFAGALEAEIGSLFFRADSGRKVEAGASDVRISFAGPLQFVNALRSILPENGFDDPPSVTVDAQGIVTGYSLGLPSVGVGVFSLQNLALAAALSIPFTDRPAGVRFSISERHRPFLVTVSLFGGGGFFAVAVSAQGVEEVEASIEFGGAVSLNLGVASGGVSVMAGVYFAMKAGSVELTGYLRCGGHLEVLGLISVSLEFYLAFTYRDKDPGGSEIWGQASLTVAVKVLFFSTSVTLSVERRFAGSDGDPTFAESVPPAEWARYLQAFA